MTSLSNPLATAQQLYKRAERQGMSQDVYDVVLIATQMLTQSAGMMLGQNQTIIAQVCVLLSRYFILGDLKDKEFPFLSAAIMYTLIRQECPSYELHSISVAYQTLMAPSSNFRSSKSEKKSKEEIAQEIAPHLGKTDALILQYESDILRTLDFDFHVATPHALALIYLQSLAHFDIPAETIGQMTLALLNTALISPQMLYLTHQPNELAIGAMYVACLELKVEMPSVDWWEIFDVDREVLGFVVMSFVSLRNDIEIQNKAIPELEHGAITLQQVVSLLD